VTQLRVGLTTDVRVWKIHTYRGKLRTTYTVKWSVEGRRHQRTFTSRKYAEAFRSELTLAARDGVLFELFSGLAVSMTTPASADTWFRHAMAFVDSKWSRASARHRRGIAEAMTDATIALLTRPIDPSRLPITRRALAQWAFNTRSRSLHGPGAYQDAIAWVEAHSLPLAGVARAAAVRAVLSAYSTKLDGSPAAPATFARKRAAFNSALQFAVEEGRLAANPLKAVRWSVPESAGVVDRRVVVNPDQARALLSAVWDLTPPAAAFFATLYYAGLRPAEARNLRIRDCELPESGWGELVLRSSHQTAGSAWTDSGTVSEERGLKHRTLRDERVVPAHPELVTVLRRHLTHFLPGVDGHLFVTRTGKAGVPLPPPYSQPIGQGTIYRVWHAARDMALTAEQAASPLARRPYDLRHACLSTWLNAGVPAPQVAAWAGHSTEVLLRVYAKCVDGQEDLAKSRIESALR
jgi:integrase